MVKLFEEIQVRVVCLYFGFSDPFRIAACMYSTMSYRSTNGKQHTSIFKDDRYLYCKKPSLHPRLTILFLCTAHNSLSQRLYLVLSAEHNVTIEYALSEELIISAAEIVRPDLILCPFLTSKVPSAVFEKYMTLIVHPGPPGDAGPSALDWVLMGDDGNIEDATILLNDLNDNPSQEGRDFWGVSVLQAIEKFDEGPIWAYEQFPINIDEQGLTKSELYRGPVTRAAVLAVTTAIDRIVEAALLFTHKQDEKNLFEPINPHDHLTRSLSETFEERNKISFISRALSFKKGIRGLYRTHSEPDKGFVAVVPMISENSVIAYAPLNPRFIPDSKLSITPSLVAKPSYTKLSVGAHMPFSGGITRHRPLLKPAQRTFDLSKHDARYTSRRLRSADSQPGVMSEAFGMRLYLYGGVIEDSRQGAPTPRIHSFGTVLGTRDDSICLEAACGRGIWITHIRRPKRKIDKALWPKVPAIEGLVSLGILDQEYLKTSWSIGYTPRTYSAYQEITLRYEPHSFGHVAYLSWDFYNGAMTTKQCRRLLDALKTVLLRHSGKHGYIPMPIVAIVLQGGSYFSNGIALNTIEAHDSPSDEAWANINAINDIVFSILHSFASYKIITIAAIRGNAAAGGVALAAACDVVMCSQNVVLNPSYRGVGLYGSEYHSITYPGRCGIENAQRVLNLMIPLDAEEARSIGLVDLVIPGHGSELNHRIKSMVTSILSGTVITTDWKIRPIQTESGTKVIDITTEGLAKQRAHELGEMAKDFWSPRKTRFDTRRWAFVRKSVPTATPLRFAKHRRNVGDLDLEERKTWDEVQWWQEKAESEIAELKTKGPGLFHCYYGPVEKARSEA